MDNSTLKTIKKYIRSSQGIQDKIKIEFELVENYQALSKKEFDSIYDNTVKAKHYSDNSFKFLLAGFLSFGILFLFGIHFAHKSRSLDENNQKAL